MRYILLTATWLVGGFLVSACLYDADEPCGEGQVLRDGACHCEDGSALVGKTCVACGPGEEATENGCETALESLGEPCTNSDECNPDGANLCVDDEEESYCSLGGCETSLDCPETFACDVERTEPACIKGPSGFGTSCEDSAECEGFEAAYCESLQEKVCMLECGDDPSVCPSDWVCCDFSGLVGAALCLPPGDLDDGSCPFGVDALEDE